MATIKSLIVLLAVIFYICMTGVNCAEEEKNSTTVLSPNSTTAGNSSVSPVGNATDSQVSTRGLRTGERQGRCQIVWQWIKALFSPTDTTKSGDLSTKKTGSSKKFLLSPETTKDKSSTRDTEEEDKDSDREARRSHEKMRQNKKLKPLTYELPW